ncbi:Retrovirus-related Pol polyprotein Reverse transcriptase [Channa argus]|uniref:Retrovirus-related Pol polyprotein Reverse transcriptase n=1 Tax=Channa argus TaxID=215402 RepID=A0A6G1PIG5_CHAAH|nr:Retrovirus-related Pol polyprotein Reverse transcriptase [Channa argus]
MTGHHEDMMLDYCAKLSASLSVLCPQVKAALSTPADTNLHNLKPGDWVLIKDHRRKHWRQRRFTGPHQVLLTSSTAVKVEGHATWVHASHCKKIPTPGAEKELHPEEHQLDMETTAVEDDQQDPVSNLLTPVPPHLLLPSKTSCLWPHKEVC